MRRERPAFDRLAHLPHLKDVSDTSPIQKTAKLTMDTIPEADLQYLNSVLHPKVEYSKIMPPTRSLFPAGNSFEPIRVAGILGKFLTATKKTSLSERFGTV